MITAHKKIAIKLPENSDFITKARELAHILKVPLLKSEQLKDFDFILVFTNDHLQLQRSLHPKEKPLFIDFCSNKLLHRQKYGGGRGQLIAKAVSTKNTKPENVKVLDATAGLGADAFVLASLGYQVTMAERSSIIGALLENALERAKKNPEFSKLHLKLIIGDAISYMKKIANNEKLKPDVIYVDPMFPERQKSALNKKEMRILKEIVGEDLDAGDLLNAALKCARKKVVVKRPRLAPTINEIIPKLTYQGKSCRYDVYW
jgi:16S rRNA (guanine1516-N2)-methyltransferase